MFWKQNKFGGVSFFFGKDTNVPADTDNHKVTEQ